jgi:hypothetical protein
MSFDEAQVRRDTSGKFSEKTGAQPEVALDTAEVQTPAHIAAAGIAQAWGVANYTVHEPVAAGRDSFVEFIEDDGTVKYSADIDGEGRPTRVFLNHKPMDPESQVVQMAVEGADDALGLPHLNYAERRRREAANFETRMMYGTYGAADYMDETGERFARVSELRDVDVTYKNLIREQATGPLEPDQRALYLKAATIMAARRSRELRAEGERAEYSRLPDSNAFRESGNRSEITEQFAALTDETPLDPFQRRILFEQAMERSAELDK